MVFFQKVAKPFLIVLSVTFCLYPSVSMEISCDESKLTTAARNRVRLEKIRLGYLSIATTHRAHSLRLFLRNRDLIPNHATVYVIGPGLNFYEWVAFLVVREDVLVVVFETLNSLLLEQLQRDSELKFFWEALVRVNPELLLTSSIRTFDQFKQAIQRRLIVKGEYRSQVRHDSSPPLADVIFANYPHNTFELRHDTPRLKPNGLIWVQSEDIESRTGIRLAQTTYLIEDRNFPMIKFLSAQLPVWTRPYWNQPIARQDSEIVLMRGYFPVMFQSAFDKVYFIIPK